MRHKPIKGKTFTWHHFSDLDELDFDFMHKNFQFHPLDFDDLREAVELPKVDVYKHYVFAVFVVPVLDKNGNRVGKTNLPVFIGKDYIVTATLKPIDSVERIFVRMQRNRSLKQEAMNKSTGFFLYKLLDYVFRDVNVVLQELVKETQNMEKLV
ncbi:MAG: CorA family divalent cation transporter, partial [Patescibacteria group bacterium]